MKLNFEEWLSFVIEWGFVILAIIFSIALFIIGFTTPAHAEVDYLTLSNEVIVNAIFKAEGGYKATYLYGIRSIPYSCESEARKICLNTIRNNKVRFLKQTKFNDFIEFLGSRYCPIGCDNDRGTNKYWVRNVKHFLEVAQ